MNLSQRFRVTFDAADPKEWEGPYTISVKDADDTILFTAGNCAKAYSDEYEKLMKQAKDYLRTNYPEWENPSKYWD